ncbi:MAG: sodium:proton antiporter NhaD [Bacteroidia bacterium]|nr:sodium:proton antiporter NhaD [Bacteroidia bacterium]
MGLAIVLVFVLGYVAIALEHPLKIDKAASALVTGVVCWTLFAVGAEGMGFKMEYVEEELGHHLAEISQILFFLIGAMTIVELVDIHGGFEVITSRIKTKNKRSLIWIICILTFFLSALLDNLTTSIVMVSLLSKLIKTREERLIYAGMIVIAANSGGAWSPIGDVTTTMLWIEGQITTGDIISHLILPALVSLVVPLIIVTFMLKGEVEAPDLVQEQGQHKTTRGERNLVFFLGVGGLIFVPVYKILFHLPPYMGMMLSLGILWAVTELLHKNKKDKFKAKVSAAYALEKIDIPSVLFFLGILLAVSTLQSTHQLAGLSTLLNQKVGDQNIIMTAIGLLSSIVDNVPLVKAAQGMYDMGAFPTDHSLWKYLAYCAGTGGSVLIIGSAAGVAVMGIEKIDFIWYLKRMSLLALAGYFAGAAVYFLMFGLIPH